MPEVSSVVQTRRLGHPQVETQKRGGVAFRHGPLSALPASSSLRYFILCIGLTWPALSSALCQSPALLAIPPRTWAFDASNNEIPIIEHRETYLRYQLHLADEKGVQLRDIIESRDGTVARLIKRDDRPLTPEEDAAERDRLNDLLASPAAYQKHEASDVNGKKRAVELIRMLPDAMIFTYAPGQPQIDSPAGEQVVLDFKPNPDWRPPSLTAEALTGLEGRVWIDRKTRHMVRMEGDIFQTVSLGWGMLARIYPGGHLALDQAPTPTNRWIFSRFLEQITVRALMVKTIHQNANISTGAYQKIEPMTYQEAIRLLLATPLPK